VIDYELSLTDAGSIVLYKGATVGSIAVDNNTVAGSSTGMTWIHGRTVAVVVAPTVYCLSSHTGTANVPTAGTAAGLYMVRITFLKIA
jgi:hypothetical protein